MTIGLLEKKLEGGGENHPPPALIPLAKQPARRRVKISMLNYVKIEIQLFQTSL